MRRRPDPSPIDEIAVRPGELDFRQPLGRFLIMLFRQFEDELLAGLRERGHARINASDFNVLRFVDPRGISGAEVAKLAGVSKQAISRQVAALERARLVARKGSPNDQRAKVIVFTKKGERLVRDAIDVIRQIERRYDAALGEGELDRLKVQLGRLISSD